MVLFTLAVGLALSGAYAECPYFRVSAKLLKCAAVDPKSPELKNAYEDATPSPDLEEPDGKPLVRIRCECEYSLSGSDVRCDMDQVIERDSVVGVENAVDTCRRGNTLCRSVCPGRLP
jgi:hypothetical protein